MAARTRFALVFWIAVAVVVTILTIQPWASAPESEGLSAGPIATRDVIYRPQHWDVYGRFGKHPRVNAGGSSLAFAVRRFENGRPARDLRLHKSREVRRRALVLARQ